MNITPTTGVAESSAVEGHTPGPWKLCSDGECSCLMITCPDHPIAQVKCGEWGDEYPAMRQVGPSQDNKYESYMERIVYGVISKDEATANARLIVAAVNAYPRLHAMEKALREIDAKCSGDRRTVNEFNVMEIFREINAILVDVRSIARDAISKGGVST